MISNPQSVRDIGSQTARRLRSAAGLIYHRTVLRRQPRVFCNSFPKSGTHLLVGLVSGFPSVHDHNHGVYWHHVTRCRLDEARIPTVPGAIAELRACLSGELYRGHVEAEPRISAYLRESGFKNIFIYRDPRDVVVSLLFWWHRHSEIDSWPFRYFHALESDADRLSFLIEGWPSNLKVSGFPKCVDFPDIGARFAAFRPWIGDPSCLSIRFEDLRSPVTRDATYRTIASHVFPESSFATLESHVERMIASSAPERSKTFRKGTSGDWRNHLTPRHVELFKHHAGDLIVDLGYESDSGWGLDADRAQESESLRRITG